jgi:actin related protein 2/3 complex subunit 2
MGLVCFPQLLKHGAGDVLAREYGSYYVQPEQGYNVTISIDLKTLPADIEPLIKALSLLKRNALAAPFERAFSHQQQKLQSELMAIDFRPGEEIYIKALPDRVTVIFSTEFQDETDQIYGKVFLQEFVDARRQPHIQNAPQVLYSSKEPPLELQGVQVKQSDSVGFVTFVFFPRHFQGDKGYECISKIQLFRDYFHYHIKASKAYLHSRMRARVHSFMKVLNRAKPEIKSEQKTAGYFYFDIGAKLFKDRSIV